MLLGASIPASRCRFGGEAKMDRLAKVHLQPLGIIGYNEGHPGETQRDIAKGYDVRPHKVD